VASLVRPESGAEETISARMKEAEFLSLKESGGIAEGVDPVICRENLSRERLPVDQESIRRCLHPNFIGAMMAQERVFARLHRFCRAIADIEKFGQGMKPGQWPKIALVRVGLLS
jgi:hypothetical protein